MEEWKSGRMEERKNGGVEEWRNFSNLPAFQ
jgi:hypothetical protein